MEVVLHLLSKASFVANQSVDKRRGSAVGRLWQFTLLTTGRADHLLEGSESKGVTSRLDIFELGGLALRR